jgi:hypothetical protein
MDLHLLLGFMDMDIASVGPVLCEISDTLPGKQVSFTNMTFVDISAISFKRV